MKKVTLIFLMSIISTSITAQALKKTKILILGTPHLSGMQNMNSIYLNKVLDSLTIYKFEAIGIENMSAELLFDINSRPSKFWQELYTYYSNQIKIGKKFNQSLNVSYESASSLLDSLSKKGNINDVERIQLINASLCSYNIWSSVLNYKYLNNKSVVDTTITNSISKYEKSNNEINLVGVNLAKRLNLNKLEYIDSQQDETILNSKFPEFYSDYDKAAERIKELQSKVTIYKEIEQLTKECLEKKDFFPLYKFLNSKKYMLEDFDGQWNFWLKTNFKSKTDRSRYSLWEMRNLQITANIIRLASKYPEGIILIIIGASHKSFIEKYLKQMPDIELLAF
jgi:hypothetical protein